MAVATTSRTATGVAVLTDALAVGRNDRGHELGAGSPGVLLRRVVCTEGTVELAVEYAPGSSTGASTPS
jgi:alpha,alpha-trehalase